MTELENLVVFVLVAVFERTLREYVTDTMNSVMTSAVLLQEKMREHLAEDIEYWRFRERLIDTFVNVPEAERGNVKQLVKFRDWVAHGHFLKEPRPVAADVRTTYDRLTNFLRTAGIVI